MIHPDTDKIKFSIIIPTYNNFTELRECLDAISNQTISKNNFEVIVVDDGSQETSSANSIPPHIQFPIRYFYQDHKGPATARNLGIKEAKGDIILLLDDDSLPTDNWLDRVIFAWDNFSDSDGIGGYIKRRENDTICCRVNSDLYNWFLNQNSDGRNCSFLVSCNAGYKKAILNKVGNFDESFKKASAEERDLNIRISTLGGKLRLMKDILVYHDRGLTFFSFAKKHYNFGKAAFTIYSRHPDLKHFSAKSYFNLYSTIIKTYKPFLEKSLVFALITISQLATAAGFYIAMFSEKPE